jgi:hypothetical protein
MTIETINQKIINTTILIGAKLDVCLLNTICVSSLSNSLFSRNGINFNGAAANCISGCEYGSGITNALNNNTAGTTTPTNKYNAVFLIDRSSMDIHTHITIYRGPKKRV